MGGEEEAGGWDAEGDEVVGWAGEGRFMGLGSWSWGLNLEGWHCGGCG